MNIKINHTFNLDINAIAFEAYPADDTPSHVSSKQIASAIIKNSTKFLLIAIHDFDGVHFSLPALYSLYYRDHPKYLLCRDFSFTPPCIINGVSYSHLYGYCLAEDK